MFQVSCRGSPLDLETSSSFCMVDSVNYILPPYPEISSQAGSACGNFRQGSSTTLVHWHAKKSPLSNERLVWWAPLESNMCLQDVASQSIKFCLLLAFLASLSTPPDFRLRHFIIGTVHQGCDPAPGASPSNVLIVILLHLTALVLCARNQRISRLNVSTDPWDLLELPW